MQHTEKYNFSLIDAGDAFSPDALNANARQLEDQLARVDAAAAAETARVNTALNAKAAQTALTAEETARKTEVARLDAAAAAEQTRVNGEITKLSTAIGAGGTTARIVTGSYKGKGTYDQANPNSLDFAKTLGCLPKLLVILAPTSGYKLFLTPGMTIQTSLCSGNNPCYITWTATGVSWYSTYSPSSQMNSGDKTYYYIAFA